MNRLFAVYLGGKAPRASIELHDIAFGVGPTIEDTLPQLREQWFGSPESVHIDSWAELTEVDGFHIRLETQDSSAAPLPENAPKLYFVNIGSYTGKKLGENHHFLFLVAESAPPAKKRAKEIVQSSAEVQPHTDNLFEVDSLIELERIQNFRIQLTPHHRTSPPLEFNNGYWPISQAGASSKSKPAAPSHSSVPCAQCGSL